MEEAEEYQPGAADEVIILQHQETILFYGKPLIVGRLPDGRPGVVLRSLTDNMQLDRVGQIRRVQRTEAIADDLVSNVRIETDGGPQRVHVLAIRAVAYWLATIDAKRVREEIRPDIIRYQREAVDALYVWAQGTRSIGAGAYEPKTLSAGQSTLPTTRTEPSSAPVFPVPMEEPGPDADHADHASYHEAMSLWHRWLADYHAQQWRQEVKARMEDQEARIESKEAVLDLVPEVLERLGPETITRQHQEQVQAYVRRLSEATGRTHGAIYADLKTVFQKPRYDELLESEWPQVARWFEIQIQRAREKRGGKR